MSIKFGIADSKMSAWFRDNRNRRKISNIKYIGMFLLMTIACYKCGQKRDFVNGVFEFLLIMLFTEMISTRLPKIRYGVNAALSLLFNVQYAVYMFSGSFLNLLMVSNIDSIQMLRGRVVTYIGMTIVVIILSFLPTVSCFFLSDKVFEMLSFVLVGELALTLVIGNTSSPMFGYGRFLTEVYRQNAVRLQSADVENAAQSFYKDGIMQARQKPQNLCENPNIILIFTEGLSEQIVMDERNIMPNVRRYQEKSLSFSRYYNHTFATYRGIIGQLFSGEQLRNTDRNQLISIQSVLKKQGYHAAFINVEPYNADFTGYLEGLGFDEVVDHMGGGDADGQRTDKESYALLFDYCETMHKSEKPFFYCNLYGRNACVF